MKTIKKDKHSYYIKENGNLFRPLWPLRDRGEAITMKMLPEDHKNDLTNVKVNTELWDNFLIVTLPDKKELWFNHGYTQGRKSIDAFRDFEKEDEWIQSLISKGLSISDAYAVLYKSLIQPK